MTYTTIVFFRNSKYRVSQTVSHDTIRGRLVVYTGFLFGFSLLYCNLREYPFFFCILNYPFFTRYPRKRDPLYVMLWEADNGVKLIPISVPSPVFRWNGVPVFRWNGVDIVVKMSGDDLYNHRFF